MYPVIDLFAGPGGLNEGFSSVNDPTSENRSFDSLASFEMDEYACDTLRLRETYRQLRWAKANTAPYYEYVRGNITLAEAKSHEDFNQAYKLANEHIQRVELGEQSRQLVDAKIEDLLGTESDRGHWVLIGGPPCQAYSLAGRSRRTGDENFMEDHKHFLYKEYLHIVSKFKPSIFVMENVKGLLSSKGGKDGMFSNILTDLQQLESGVKYEIRSLVVDKDPEDLNPKEYIIQSEKHGIPQKRHRVILLGVRSDIAPIAPRIVLAESEESVTVRAAIGDLPDVSADVSAKAAQKARDWENIERKALKIVADMPEPDVRQKQRGTDQAVKDYLDWVTDAKTELPTMQHIPRRHMISDLVRYRVMAEMALKLGKSPKYTDLPDELHPEHSNIGNESVPFTDRFRVQAWDLPSTTVVSHISKDGHYYIHPDPKQNRSLTVREAARLQTFPDDYFFEGPRTAQFHQVGNAVPPLLSNKIGQVVRRMLDAVSLNENSQPRVH